MATATAALARASDAHAARPTADEDRSRRILIIADPGNDASSIATNLRLAGYHALLAPPSLVPTLRSLHRFLPDVVLLWTSAGPGSREIFSVVQSASRAPTIVLGEPSEAQQLWFLEHGAAEYLVAPVSFKLLNAHLRSVLRWHMPAPRAGVQRSGDLEIDAASHRVRYRGATIPLTRTEFRLLQTLVENKGKLCTHEMLLERVWGRQFTTCTNYLRLYVRYLRHKLGDPDGTRLIVNEWGLGYRLLYGKGDASPAP